MKKNPHDNNDVIKPSSSFGVAISLWRHWALLSKVGVLATRACIGELLGRNKSFVGSLQTATPRVETCRTLWRCWNIFGCHGDGEIWPCLILSCTLDGAGERVGSPRGYLGNRKRVFVASSIWGRVVEWGNNLLSYFVESQQIFFLQ